MYFSACCILDDQLTEDIFCSLCKNPTQAIPFAIQWVGGIDKVKNVNEPGVKEYLDIQKASKIMGETGGGSFFKKDGSLCKKPLPIPAHIQKFEDLTLFAFLPKEILHNIASLSGNNTLDHGTRDELINYTLGLNPQQKLLNAIQTLLPQPENPSENLLLECIGQTLKIHFNSAQAAKCLYDICKQHNNIYQWIYNPQSESQFILLKDLPQIGYFISDICKFDFNEFCKNNPKFNVEPEKMLGPSPKR